MDLDMKGIRRDVIVTPNLLANMNVQSSQKPVCRIVQINRFSWREPAAMSKLEYCQLSEQNFNQQVERHNRSHHTLQSKITLCQCPPLLF